MPAALEVWLAERTRDELLEYIHGLVGTVDGVGDWLALRQLSEHAEPAEIRAEVNSVLGMSRRHLSYYGAIDYARDAGGIVDLLDDAAADPTRELLPVIERGVTLATRAILNADDSAGAIGDVVHRLLDIHARAVQGLAQRLAKRDRLRIADWLITYRYDGEQDFFDPDIVAYASALDDDGVARYREGIARQDLGDYGRYPLERLGVLDRDERAIVAAHRGEPKNAMVAARIVDALLEAQLHDAALRYARIGLGLPAAERVPKLADLLVEVALHEGDDDEAITIRRQQFQRHASSDTFGSLRDTATRLGRWDGERETAEQTLCVRSAWQFINYLLAEHRDDEAWQLAVADPASADASARWRELCERRAQTHPADTLPVYRELVTSALATADKRNYQLAADLLVAMRSAAHAAGEAEQFAFFRAAMVERNRRRPTCIEVFRRQGLA